MPYPIDKKLVIAVASSALFDLSASDKVFRTRHLEEYRKFQRRNEKKALDPGVAFPFVKRLLQLNGDGMGEQPVEVVLLSRNDPDTGLRVFNSIESHKLAITRGAFLNGAEPYIYAPAFNASLFLSANQTDVEKAIAAGHPAGRVLKSKYAKVESDHGLRVAFDFDCVLADDEAERVFQEVGLKGFQTSEQKKAFQEHRAGPMLRLAKGLALLQQRGRSKIRGRKQPQFDIRIAVITSRNAPAHQRVVNTLRTWGLHVDETFFLGGMDKTRILEVFRPHLFFDDQMTHALPASGAVPSVHVPFGVVNEAQRKPPASRIKK